jgi:hypothetical protein
MNDYSRVIRNVTKPMSCIPVPIPLSWVYTSLRRGIRKEQGNLEKGRKPLGGNIKKGAGETCT